MNKFILTVLLGICFLPVFSQNIYTGTLATTDPTFNRPDEGTPPTMLSVEHTNVYYDIITITVTTTGLITFNGNSIWDNFAILYNANGFNPAAPLTNALVASDDFSGPNFGFTYNFTTAGTYYLVVCSFKNDVTGPYTVSQSAVVILPLRLLSFTAAKAGGKSNIIKWSSAEESNLSTYQIQRSIDDNNFTDLLNGSISAKNNSSATLYNFMDNYPVTGNNFYRLKITENSGRVSYSHVALVKNYIAGITNLRVFPNPATDFIRLEGKTMVNKQAFVSIINSVGSVIHSGQYQFNSQAVLSVDIRKLPAGKYFIKTAIDKEEGTIIFIKK